MRQFTTEEINSWGPCYPAEKYLKPGDSHTVLSILDDKRIPFEDRLWVVCRRDLLSEKLMRLFAVWCARQVQHLMGDERSIKALDVAEAFANGKASSAELAAAREAARAAAREAAREAALAAALAAACDDVAWVAAEAAQESKLREMIIAGIETGDVK